MATAAALEAVTHDEYPRWAYGANEIGPVPIISSTSELIGHLASETRQPAGWIERMANLDDASKRAITELADRELSGDWVGPVRNPLRIDSNQSAIRDIRIEGFGVGVHGEWHMSGLDVSGCGIGLTTNVIANARIHGNDVGVRPHLDGPADGTAILRVKDSQFWDNAEADIDLGVTTEELRELGLRRPRMLRTTAARLRPQDAFL
jgi:hypothetical protein